MDTREFYGTFLKPADVQTPIVLTIASVDKGRFGLDLSFSDGSQMGLNQTNWRAITKVRGVDSNNWLDKQVELNAGTVPYDGKEVETILLNPVSPAMSAGELAVTKPPKSGGPVDDDIPFN